VSARDAYLAGIVDGEGYIGIKRSVNPGRRTVGHHARVQVKMNRPAPAVELLAVRFGGRCAPEQGMLCWQVTDAAAERALQALLPYLVVKAEQARNVLALREHQKTSRQHRTKPIGERRFQNQHGAVLTVTTRVLSDEYIATCDDFWRRGKTLNGRG
jgi:hypothetical protein